MQMRTEAGIVELRVVYGQDPHDGHWGCPMRELWGLSPHQQLSLALEDKLAFTITATGSYEEAAAVSAKWGCALEDSTLHALAQRVGARAEEKIQERMKAPPAEQEPQRAASPLAVLLMDGWMARFRAEGWGRKKTQKSRVEWHEIKTGVFYNDQQRAQGVSGRGMLAQKVIVNWQGAPQELGRRLNWEGLRLGLAQARQKLVLSDGAAWIWNLKEDRWKEADELLDFYHASQHLWRMGDALWGEGKSAFWVEPRLHQLRHGQEKKLLRELNQIKGSGLRGKVLREERNYFQRHAGRMNYQQAVSRGWPIGSGAVESACRQKQCRFKRCGQFWTQKGFRHLCALDEARRNRHWDELWNA
jgi:hypothetical protein